MQFRSDVAEAEIFCIILLENRFGPRRNWTEETIPLKYPGNFKATLNSLVSRRIIASNFLMGVPLGLQEFVWRECIFEVIGEEALCPGGLSINQIENELSNHYQTKRLLDRKDRNVVLEITAQNKLSIETNHMSCKGSVIVSLGDGIDISGQSLVAKSTIKTSISDSGREEYRVRTSSQIIEQQTILAAPNGSISVKMEDTIHFTAVKTLAKEGTHLEARNLELDSQSLTNMQSESRRVERNHFFNKGTSVSNKCIQTTHEIPCSLVDEKQITLKGSNKITQKGPQFVSPVVNTTAPELVDSARRMLQISSHSSSKETAWTSSSHRRHEHHIAPVPTQYCADIATFSGGKAILEAPLMPLNVEDRMEKMDLREGRGMYTLSQNDVRDRLLRSDTMTRNVTSDMVISASVPPDTWISSVPGTLSFRGVEGNMKLLDIGPKDFSLSDAPMTQTLSQTTSTSGLLGGPFQAPAFKQMLSDLNRPRVPLLKVTGALNAANQVAGLVTAGVKAGTHVVASNSMGAISSLAAPVTSLTFGTQETSVTQNSSMPVRSNLTVDHLKASNSHSSCISIQGSLTVDKVAEKINIDRLTLQTSKNEKILQCIQSSTTYSFNPLDISVSYGWSEGSEEKSSIQHKSAVLSIKEAANLNIKTIRNEGSLLEVKSGSINIEKMEMIDKPDTYHAQSSHDSFSVSVPVGQLCIGNIPGAAASTALSLQMQMEDISESRIVTRGGLARLDLGSCNATLGETVYHKIPDCHSYSQSGFANPLCPAVSLYQTTSTIIDWIQFDPVISLKKFEVKAVQKKNSSVDNNINGGAPRPTLDFKNDDPEAVVPTSTEKETSAVNIDSIALRQVEMLWDTINNDTIRALDLAGMMSVESQDPSTPSVFFKWNSDYKLNSNEYSHIRPTAVNIGSLNSIIPLCGFVMVEIGKRGEILGLLKHSGEEMIHQATHLKKGWGVPQLSGILFEHQQVATFNKNAIKSGYSHIKSVTTASLGRPSDKINDIIVMNKNNIETSAQLKTGRRAAIRASKAANGLETANQFIVPSDAVKTSAAVSDKIKVTTKNGKIITSDSVNHVELTKMTTDARIGRNPLVSDSSVVHIKNVKGNTIKNISKAIKYVGKSVLIAGVLWSVTENVVDVYRGEKRIGEAIVYFALDASGAQLAIDIYSLLTHFLSPDSINVNIHNTEPILQFHY